MGDGTQASNFASVAMGFGAVAAGQESFAMGRYVVASSRGGIALGHFNVTGGDPINFLANDPLFELGNGTDFSARSNAFTVLKNGKTSINGSGPLVMLEINGTDAIKLPIGTTAQRPGTPQTGYFRFNSSTSNIEYYNGSGWTSPATATTLINNPGTNNLFAGSPIGTTTTGTDNAFFGAGAGDTNSSGSWNVFMGASAGTANTTGALNTLIGWNAGVSVSAANGNTFLGAQAGESTTQSVNTFIGEKAGRFTSTGSENVFMGNSAGDTNVNGGSNTIIGYNADVGAAALQNATAIGSRASVNQSNSLVLGSINGVNGATSNTSVGIGTTTPSAPLHIATRTGSFASQAFTSFAQGNVSLNNGTAAGSNIAVRADGFYWSSGYGFIATSDKRIKDIVGKTDNQRDLNDLLKIEITDYKFIDKISMGNRIHKKVIAQQIETVYPLATNKTEGVVPSVFELARKVKVDGNKTIIETFKPHLFNTNDEVKLILENGGERQFMVTVVNDSSFIINEAIIGNVFVYGKKVADLLTVDYDALTTLNISATQQLSKEVENLKVKLNERELKIAELEASLKALKKQNASLETLTEEVEKIKASLGISAEAVAPVKKEENKNEE
jgi:hypothetical protein